MPPAYTPDLNDPQMQTTHHAASVHHTANSQDPHPEAEDPDTRTDAEEATATTVIKKEKTVIQLLILLLGYQLNMSEPILNALFNVLVKFSENQLVYRQNVITIFLYKITLLKSEADISRIYSDTRI
jgi:hypothetical protein